MWDPISYGTMPDFWPARPRRFWDVALTPVRKVYLKKVYGLASLELEGAEQALAGVRRGDGVLFAPNHSHDSDPHVMIEVGKRLKRQVFFMAAWQLFKGHKGIDGWVMQRMGAFSVDREGTDRRAMKEAIEILCKGGNLVIFPEGEVYRLNDRLTPLKEGVAFLALAAQKEMAKQKGVGEKEGNGGSVWIVPTAIRYTYMDNVIPALEVSMGRLEALLSVKAGGLSLERRLVRFGEMMLTVKEKERFGRSFESTGDLGARVARFVRELLAELEMKHLGKLQEGQSVPVRVKMLRRELIEIYNDKKRTEAERQEARGALNDVQLVLQLFGYQGDYVKERPTVERMAEQIEKLEEDLLGEVKPKGKKKARVVLGAAMDLRPYASGRARSGAGEVSGKLEAAIRGLMD